MTTQDTSSYFRFQSTLPVRGATMPTPPTRQRRKNFNPRSPCGERQFFHCQILLYLVFQSTLPVRGATIVGGYGDLYLWVFQSTLPVRGATLAILKSNQ